MKIFLLFLTITSSTLSQKPIMRWIHGIGSNCLLENETFKPHFASYNASCIETTMGFLTSFPDQIKLACKSLQSEKETLKSGFTLIGISQGGLIARAVLQKCEIGKYIKRLITIGGPHNGVAVIPNLGPNNFANIIIQACFYELVMNRVGPCGYINSLKYEKEFLESSSVLKDINNLGEVNQGYKDRIRGLELFMAIGFESDTMIQPRNTAVFGFYKSAEYRETHEMEDERVFKEDLLGLKALEAEGRLFRCVVPGGHLQIGKFMEPLVLDFSNYLNQDYKNGLGEIKDVCRFNIE